jgi:hypothetical protein
VHPHPYTWLCSVLSFLIKQGALCSKNTKSCKSEKTKCIQMVVICLYVCIGFLLDVITFQIKLFVSYLL